MLKVKTPSAKVLGVFFRPCSAAKTLCEHFEFHAVSHRC